MKHKPSSTDLYGHDDKSLSGWNEAISEAKEQIRALKRSIRTFEELRDGGMRWPGTSEKDKPFRGRVQRNDL